MIRLYQPAWVTYDTDGEPGYVILRLIGNETPDKEEATRAAENAADQDPPSDISELEPFIIILSHEEQSN